MAPGAGPALLDALRRRYNFIVADAPYSTSSFHHELLELSHQRVIVTLPTLVGIRDTLRLLALLPGAEQIQRAVVVLKIWSGLTFAAIASALELPMNTCASRYRHALIHLAELLEEARDEK